MPETFWPNPARRGERLPARCGVVDLGSNSVRLVVFEGRGRNTRLEYQGAVDISDAARLTFGAETEQSRLRTRSPFGGELERDVRTHSAYGQGSLRLGAGLSLTAGGR